MHEIVHIQVGQCGNQTGSRFWDVLCEEHGIDNGGTYTGSEDYQLQRINVYFNEVNGNKYVPRALLVDLDRNVIDGIRNGPLSTFFHPHSYVVGQHGAGNNWAKGHFTDGAEMLDRTMDILRQEAEACDCLQGFQLTHSLGGGTGSGLGSLLLETLREEYPDRLLCTYSIAPSPKVSNTVEPYNAAFTIKNLIEYADEVFLIDNDALLNICFGKLKIVKPTFDDVNSLVSLAMGGVTSSFRFPGQLNSDLRRLTVNLIPFTRMHFFTVGTTPLLPDPVKEFRSVSIPDLVQQMMDKNNMMISCAQPGIYLTAAAMFRGKTISTKEVEVHMKSIISKNSSSFVEWIPDNIKTSVSPYGQKTEVTFVANSTSVKEVFSRIADQFRAMYRKRAFVHWYLGEGMDPSLFDYAESNLLDLIGEYQLYTAEAWEDSDSE